MKKILAGLLALSTAAVVFAGCSPKDDNSDGGANADGGKDTVLKVAALESAYGADMWKEIEKAFEAANPGVDVQLTTDKNIEDILSPQMKSGEYPDVVHLATGRPQALTETLTKEKALLDLTDVLSMTIPGEDVTVNEKLVGGFTDTLVTNPYGDGKTYLAPMFYGPCGLFYNKALLEEKGWTVPETWDEMWELGDKAKAEGIALFTYPTTGYFDALFYSLLTSIGGPDFYNSAMTYEEGIWDTDEAKLAFEIVGKLAKYTESTTVANANKDNYLKNQQLVLDNKAIFMPNGTWVTGEMADAPRADGFEWGFTALPAAEKDGDKYSFTFFEQMWVPAKAENPDLAKKFVAYMYSDEAAKIFATKGDSAAVQPIKGISEMLEGENKLFYSIYDDGAKAAMGGFASTAPVEGVNMYATLFETIDSVVSGDKTVEQWRQAVKEASDKLREAM